MSLELAERPATAVVAPIHSRGALAESSPAAIMLTALERGISPADLRDMLALQREWQADQARAAFFEALANFKTHPVIVRKRKAVGYESKAGEWVGYKHAELSDVVAAVDEALPAVGLSYRWEVRQEKDWVSVSCILSHRLGHSERVEMGGPPDHSGKKNAIQAIASTVTYLKRYTLKAITGVAEAGDDDDGRGGPDDKTGGGDGGEPPKAAGETPSAGDGRPTYPAADFARNLPSWQAAIRAGKKTAEQVIATVETKGLLTDEQKASIRNTAE